MADSGSFFPSLSTPPRNLVEQLREAPHKGVHPVRRAHRGVPKIVDTKRTHLIFEFVHSAYVMDPALLVESGDRLRPDVLPSACVDQFDRNAPID